jgi:hypothetical protein
LLLASKYKEPPGSPYPPHPESEASATLGATNVSNAEDRLPLMAKLAILMLRDLMARKSDATQVDGARAVRKDEEARRETVIN